MVLSRLKGTQLNH